jgi:four helix bundle protein
VAQQVGEPLLFPCSFLALARCPIRCRAVSAPAPLWVGGAFRAADFPSASVLPSIGSTGVTHVFVDFLGTTTSSDFSRACPAACGFLPSRGCLEPTTGPEAPSRSPGSRAGDICERAELSDPGRNACSTSALFGAASWPSADKDNVGSSDDTHFEALSPGPLMPLPYASTVESPRPPQGLNFPGADSSRGRICSIPGVVVLRTCFLLPVFPAHPRPLSSSFVLVPIFWSPRPVMPNDSRLPFQRLEVYIAARTFAKLVHDAAIRDPELRDQATRASKSTFCNLCEGLPSRSVPMRRKHFGLADGSHHEALGAVDLALALGAVDPEQAQAIQAQGATLFRLLRGLMR